MNEKSAATSVVWPRSIPSASSEIDSHSLFDRLIKIVNGKFSDLYARDNYLINRKGWTRRGGRLYEPASDSMLRIRPSVDELYRGHGGGATLPAQVAKTNQKKACAPRKAAAPEMKEKRAMSAVEEINAMVKGAAWYNPFSWGYGPKPGMTRDEAIASEMGAQVSDVGRWRQMKPQTYLPKPGTRDPELPKLFPGRSQEFWNRSYARHAQQNAQNDNPVATKPRSMQMMEDAVDPAKNTPAVRAQKAMERGANDFVSRYMRSVMARGITAQEAYNRAMAAQQINKKYYTMGRDGKYVIKNPADRERARQEYRSMIAAANSRMAGGMAQNGSTAQPSLPAARS